MKPERAPSRFRLHSDGQTNEQPSRWLSIFALLQLGYGLILLPLGVLQWSDRDFRWFSAYLVFPFFSLGLIHLSLAWALFHRKRWFRLPHTASLIVWPLIPWLLSWGEPPPKDFGPGGSGLGFIPLWVALLFLTAVFLILLLYLVQAVTLLWALWSDKALFGRAPQPTYSLGLLVFVGGLVPSVIGLDWHVPVTRMQETNRRARERVETPQRVVERFIAAALVGDEATLASISREVDRLQADNYQINFANALRHDESRVRERAVVFLAEDGFLTHEVDHLLRIVADENESDLIRLQAIHAMRKIPDNRELYDVLRGVKKRQAIVVPALVAMLDDPDHNRIRTPNPREPPTEAVRLLASFGPEAKGAVPALISALDHPNTWDFAPAAADALGSMGQSAEVAIPALEKKAKPRNHDPVAVSARQAIEQIRADLAEGAEPGSPSADTPTD